MKNEGKYTQHESDFDYKDLFVPRTTGKAIFYIATIGFIVFANSLFNGFVGDDHILIVQNPLVHSIKYLAASFLTSNFNNAGQEIFIYYKPIFTSVLSILFIPFGATAFIFHLFQLFLHILNAFLLFYFFMHFFKRPLSLFLSLVFLIHPINSEAIFYISAMQEPLFFFFGILALLMLARIKSKGSLLWICLLLFLSLLSKETGILFLLVSFIYVLIYRRIYLLTFTGLSILSTLCYLLLRLSAVGIRINPLNTPIAHLTLLERFINMPALIFFYIKTFLLPLNLASSYHWAYDRITFEGFLLPLTVDALAVFTVIVTALVLRKRYKGQYFTIFLFFALWFFIGISLHLHLVPLDATVAERWFYFPMVGLLGMIGVLMAVFGTKLRSKWFVVALLAVILILLGSRTFMRSFDWRNDYTLTLHDLKVTPDSYDLENKMVHELIQRGRFEEAKVHADRSIELFPHANNYNNLGRVYLHLGDYPKAKQTYQKSIELGGNYLVYENLASVMVLTSDIEAGVNFLKESVVKFPRDSKLWKYLAILQYQKGDIENAKSSVTNTLNLNNQDPESLMLYKTIMNNQTLDLKFK